MERRSGSSRVICLTRQPDIGQSLFMLRSMGSDASSFKHQPRPAQSTQTAGEPLRRGEAQTDVPAHFALISGWVITLFSGLLDAPNTVMTGNHASNRQKLPFRHS